MHEREREFSVIKDMRQCLSRSSLRIALIKQYKGKTTTSAVGNGDWTENEMRGVPSMNPK
jgi:hypothetical protein